MDYVALLRARNVLRITAIVFGALILLTLVVRIASPTHFYVDNSSFNFGTSQNFYGKAAVVQHETLPNGVKRTIVNDPVTHRHFVIDNHGYFGTTVTEQRPTSSQKASSTVVGPGFKVHTSRRNGIKTTHFTFGGGIDLGFLAGLSILAGLILATILSCAFGSENEGHLELAFMRPRSREALAIRVIVTDVLAIIAGQLLAVVAAIAMLAIYVYPQITFSTNTVVLVLASLLLPIAWYAMILAATARMRRGYGAVAGMAWPVAGGVAGGRAAFAHQTQPVAQLLHAIITPFTYLDPFWYVQGVSMHAHRTPHIFLQTGTGSASPALWSLAVLALVYFALAVLQWRRMET